MRMDPPVSVPTDAEAHAFGDGGGRPAARAAGRSRRIDRVADGAERGLVAGGAERELVQVGLADDDRAGVAQPAARPGRRRRDRRPAPSTPAVVGVPATSTRSLTVIGMPCSGPRYRPRRSRCRRGGLRERRLAHEQRERVQLAAASTRRAQSRTRSVAETARCANERARHRRWRDLERPLSSVSSPASGGDVSPAAASRGAAPRSSAPAFRAAASLRAARGARRRRSRRRARIQRS